MCIEREIVTAAEVVDHVVPHRGDEDLFFDPRNLQSLCKHCHDSTKQRIDLGQVVVTFGPDGWPT
jgi:5-methylcytosine-specific restriction endonuclease McrA